MENQEKMTTPKKPAKFKIILAALLLVVAIIAVVVLSTMKKPATNNQPGEGTGTEVETGEVPDASTPIDEDGLQEVEIPNLDGAKVVVPGANPITKDNIVVTPEGKVTENTVLPMSDNAPKQTGFLNKEELPENVVKISVGDGKFAPASFTTKAGAPTTFSLTGVDSFSHVIAFDDPSMSAIAILVGPSQTKAITFNAPKTPGEYVFSCASPGHADKGEKGNMIVQ